MSEVADTTSSTINGKDGTADFTMNPWNSTNQSFKVILDSIIIREVTEMTRADNFSVEGVADQDPGRSQIDLSVTGIGKKGGPASGPWIPAPQNVAVLATISSGCTLSGNFNFTEATCVRLVNQTCRIAGRGLSKATYTLTWSLTGGGGVN